MSPQLEKVFFNYILVTKKFFDICKPYFFKNSEIQLVYSIVRDYMIQHNDATIPTPRQILDMVSLEDMFYALRPKGDALADHRRTI